MKLITNFITNSSSTSYIFSLDCNMEIFKDKIFLSKWNLKYCLDVYYDFLDRMVITCPDYYTMYIHYVIEDDEEDCDYIKMARELESIFEEFKIESF